MIAKDEMVFFTITYKAEIDMSKLGLPSGTGSHLHMVEFVNRDTENPLAEVIGLFMQNGTRRYSWGDKHYVEYNAPIDSMVRALRGQPDGKSSQTLELIEMLQNYYRTTGPIMLIASQEAAHRFYRILYEMQSEN